MPKGVRSSLWQKEEAGVFSSSFKYKQFKFDRNNSIFKAYKSLSLLVFPIANDFANNSLQKARADHSYFVVLT